MPDVNWWQTGQVIEADLLNSMDNGVVRFDEAQQLTPEQKEIALNNIGAAANNGVVANLAAVSYTQDQSQTLSDGQKATARNNIAAASQASVEAMQASVTQTMVALRELFRSQGHEQAIFILDQGILDLAQLG